MKAAKTKVARTRGADPTSPRNKPTLETRGYATPKEKRTRGDLRYEHRLEMLREAVILGRSAATDFDICQHFGIAQRTLTLWRSEDKEFDEALRMGARLADDAVERALYHKAVGYSYPAEKIHINADGDVTRVAYIEHVPPDTTSMIFWLKNRRRADWAETTKVDVSGQIDVRATTPQELAMAVLVALREGIEADRAPVIEHEANEDE